MRIIELYAEEFGCFLDRRFSFEAGLNLIEGANESGKSTLQALIRFLFYGFPRRGGEEGEERYRRISRKTHRAAGSVTFLWHGDAYLLYRDYILHGLGGREIPAETVCVTAVESGKRIDLGGKTPGEYFLSLPIELYHGSVCVRESELSSVANPETGDTVAEMLFFGEGGARLEAAEKILEQARRTLQHTRGSGGRIAALEEEAEALDRALESARATAERLRVLRNDIARLTVQTQDKSRELRKTEEMQRAAQLDAELARFDAWHAAKNEADKQYHAWREEEQSRFAAKAEPSTQALSEARELTSRCLLATEEAALREDAYMRCKQEASRYAQTATAHYISQNGGAEVVSARMERSAKKSRICVAFLVLFTFLSACCAAGAFVWREHWMMLISAGAISLVAMMIFGMLCRGTRRARLAMYAAMGVRSPAMLRTVLARFDSEEAMRVAAESACANAEEIYRAAMERARALFDKLKAVLADIGAPADLATDPVAATAYFDAVMQRQASAHTTHMEARLRFENAKSAAQALENGLDLTKEEELRALRATLETPDADAERLEQRRAFLKETARGIADKLATAEREEITLMARAADPAALLAQKNEVTEALFEARNRLSAIKMASEALREADAALRGSVMPTLAEKASLLFERLTGGAWKRLHVSDRFDIAVETPQGSVSLSHFSAGCRDAAHLSLRVALTDLITSEPLPLLFDEVTARLDDTRAAQLLLLLRELCAAGEQCLLFTCHTRERMLLKGEKYAHILL
ncbi:MAG: AAA family ATPase [Clostridia bacterium]|nr:AAA family ATPase [Clostridia bacterium]